jgi:hypothetical protein
MMDDARQDVLERHVGRTTMYSCTGADWRELGEDYAQLYWSRHEVGR